MRAAYGLLLVLLVLPQHAHADAGIFRGPYLNNVTTDAITVLFENPTAVTGVLRYGVNLASENTVQISPAQKHQEVRLTGLAALAPPGSRFVYELEVDGVIRSGSFYTAPNPGAAFSFVAYGDNRSSEPQHQAVVDALLAESGPPRLAMSTGDMVSSGDNEAHWDDFFRIEAPFLANTPTFLAIGNHEVDARDWRVGRRIFQHPVDVAPASGDESYYRVAYGNVELIVINVETETLYTGLLSLLAGDQEDWLEEVLANPLPSAEHRFVFIHQGPYSSKPGRNGNFWLRQWIELFKTSGIDAIISGHDHYAEWGFTKYGLPYFIHGGGGAPLYDNKGLRVEGDHTINYGVSELGYILISIDGPKARFELKNLSGGIVASFEYGDAAQPECTLAADCGGPPAFGCPGGSWECHRSACRYTCEQGSSSLVTCLTDQACVTSIAAQCPGDVHCERPGINPLEYYCACDIPPECTQNADCANRPPPIEGCAGTWACTDDVCEFSPVVVCEAPPPDAGVSEDAGAPEADAGTTSEAGVIGGDSSEPGDLSFSSPDAPTVPPDGATDGVDVLASGPDGGAPGESEPGCACATSDRSLPGADFGVYALVLLGLLVNRRRSGRRLASRGVD